MGEIIKKENLPNNKIIIHLKTTQEEAEKLKGHYKKIHLFAENLCVHKTKLIERGANNSAKYVSIPLILKSRKGLKILEINYQKIETKRKTFYIAIAKKENR